MNSKNGGGKLYGVVATSSSPKGKSISEGGSPVVGQMIPSVEDTSLDSAQEDGWKEVCTRRSKNRAGSSAAKHGVPQNSNSQSWGHTYGQKVAMRSNGGSRQISSSAWQTPTADSRGPVGRGNARHQSSNGGLANNFRVPSPATHPPQEHGPKWNAGSALGLFSENCSGKENISTPLIVEDVKVCVVNEEENDLDDINDSGDEFSSDYDSDMSQRSHETCKKSRSFKAFFKKFDSLTLEQINEPERPWHCPTCQGGPGAIDWYYGLQPLVNHAKTKGSRRVKLHRKFAELLDVELRRRGTSVIPGGEAFGKWKGLNEVVVNKEIVWPPMVVIMNTRLDMDDQNNKWKGMGNPELLEYFSSYRAVKAQHSYGPRGHRGMSVLIFEGSAIGYLEAERLSKHFEDERTDREAWDLRRVLFCPGEKRRLYGYMAEKGDLDIFNQHSQGKSKLRFEMRSYVEMVVNQIKQMSEDNQQLIWYKNRVANEQKRSKALEDSLGLESEKLRKTSEETRIVRERTKMHHQQNKEEMDFQEQFFKEQIKIIQEARGAKEENFETIQQEREKVKQSYENPSSMEDRRRRAEELAKFKTFQDKEMEDFAEEREKLIKIHEDKMVEMKRRHWKEEVELEEQFNGEFNQLMEKYTPYHSKERLSEGNSNVM